MWWALGIAQTVPNKSVHSHCQLKKKSSFTWGLLAQDLHIRKWEMHEVEPQVIHGYMHEPSHV